MTDTPRAHHPFSPSKLQYLEASPLYKSEDKETEKSLAGTKQHDATEDENTSLDDPKLNDEEAEAVDACRKFRDAIIKKYPGGSHEQESYLPMDDANLTIDGQTWEGTTAGYLDFYCLDASQTVAEICDWKFGLWSVEPTENNLQGIAYFLALVFRYPSLKTVTVHFVCPHQNCVDSHTFTSDQFDALRLRVKTVVSRALAARKSSTPTCTATVSTCLFCANKGTCLTLAKFALKVGHKYAPVEVPENVTPSLMTDPASSTQLCGIADLMGAWAKAVRAQLTAHAIDNEDWLPEGYVLRSREANKILDWKKVRAAAAAAGVTEAQLDEAMRITWEGIDKAIMDMTPRGGKKTAVQSFKDGLIQQKIVEKEKPVIFLERLKT